MTQQSFARKQAGGDARSLKHTWLSSDELYHRLRRTLKRSKLIIALGTAQEQGDQWIETRTLINLAELVLIQSQSDEASHLLNTAAPMTEENQYDDALSDISILRGDIELQQDEPDYQTLLRHYIEAMAFAENFNPINTQRVIEYLTQLLAALAEDGQAEATVRMAIDIAQLTKQIDLPDAIRAAFHALARRIEQAYISRG